MDDADDAPPVAGESVADTVDQSSDDGIEVETGEEEALAPEPVAESHRVRRAFGLIGLGFAVVLVIVIVIAMAWWPVSTSGLADRPDPTGLA